MKNKPRKREKTLYFISVVTIFILGIITSVNFGAGTLNSYLAMIGAIFVALTISFFMLKLLFKSDAHEGGDSLKFDEFAADKDEIEKKY